MGSYYYSNQQRRRRTYFATAWAQRKDPVQLISIVHFHSARVISVACVQPTTPAKQHSISTLPRRLAVSATAALTLSESLTSTCFVMIWTEGNSAIRFVMGPAACWGLISSRASPERPCSRSARAHSSARVPAPPVTVTRY